MVWPCRCKVERTWDFWVRQVRPCFGIPGLYSVKLHRYSAIADTDVLSIVDGGGKHLI
jgi:hypothetical protein